MEKRFLDTSKAIALGPSGTSSLDYEPVVTFYGQQELMNYGITLSSATTVFAPGWFEFGQPVCSGDWGSCYDWTDSNTGKNFQIYHYVRPFGPKAPCGCDATVQVFYNSQTFYCCESIAKSDVDFSYFMGTFLYSNMPPIDTQDKHLGQTCKSIHSVVNLDYQNNSSS